MRGTLEAIFIAATKAAPMTSLSTAHLVPGLGIEGDRYFMKAGSFSKKDGPDREVTLIEAEAVDALVRDYEVAFDPKDSRRNLLTRGVALNHLIGVTFLVGDVRLKGIRLAEPCGHLAKLVNNATVRKGLVHRGGLRAQILSEGTIAPGAPVRLDDTQR